MNSKSDETKKTRAGLFYGIAAYSAWGIAPLYFKATVSVPPIEVLGHRIVWSVVFLFIIIAFRNQWKDLKAAFANRKVLLYLLVSSILVAGNWLTFIWSISNNRLLEASLGYFINPLVSVVLGMIFLKERLSFLGKVSAFLALIGVLLMIVNTGSLPLVALYLAFSFGFYGLIRKVAKVGAIVGLTVETIILFPVACGFLIYLGINGMGAFGGESSNLTFLLSLAGIVTTLPLLWFAKAARRLTLASVGFLQYLAPTGQFVIGVIYGESFTLNHAITFGLIWLALIIYSYDSYRTYSKSRKI